MTVASDSMWKSNFLMFAIQAAMITGLAAGGGLAWGQQEDADHSAEALIEEVIVTARKREESLQAVPMAVTAFGERQIEAAKVRSLVDIAVGMPGASLQENGTMKGTANFSSRGLAVTSSIGGVDPAVGVFVDGVYMGLINGLIMDMFDTESIQVLRGPQGTLFGRNTTGGAVLITTKAPSDVFQVNARAAIDGNPNGDGGLNRYLMGSITGPLSDTLAAKLVVYYNDDNGWFVNDYDGKNFSAGKVKMVRPSIMWTPNDKFSLTVRYEYQDTDADGANGQSHTNGLGQDGAFVNYERGKFGLSLDEPGYDRRTVNFLTAEANWDVAFGDGSITNIFGWRDYEGHYYLDVDSQPIYAFHAEANIDYRQYSNELRYVGTFGKASVTTGVLYYTNKLKYDEGRDLLGIATGNVAPALTQDGGGIHKVDSLAWFAEMDYALNDNWTLTAGLNLTREKKDVQVASLYLNTNNPCNVIEGTCPYYFVDDKSWTNASPKVAATYHFDSDAIMYASWSRGIRSGMYNLRNTVPPAIDPLGPGPVDEETADSWELGFKTDIGNRGRLNGAVFYSTLKDSQRVIEFPGAESGTIQVIRNAADNAFYGAELEGAWAATDNLTVQGSIGYLHSSYTKVFYDFNGDGEVDNIDKSYDVPMAPDWTCSVSLNHTLDIGEWEMASRVQFAYQDEFALSETNLAYFDSSSILGAGIDFHSPNGNWVIGIYGKNLLNEVVYTNDTQLSYIGPLFIGGTFASMQKGRVLGLEVSWTY